MWQIYEELKDIRNFKIMAVESEKEANGQVLTDVTYKFISKGEKGLDY